MMLWCTTLMVYLNSECSLFLLLVMMCAMDVLWVFFFEVEGNNFRSLMLIGGKLLRMYISGFRSIRPERFPIRYGSRVSARRKGGTSGMLRPDSAGIRPEQESCPGFRHPRKRNKSRIVQPRSNKTMPLKGQTAPSRW